jgi:hypothetical protein
LPTSPKTADGSGTKFTKVTKTANTNLYFVIFVSLVIFVAAARVLMGAR